MKTSNEMRLAKGTIARIACINSKHPDQTAHAWVFISDNIISKKIWRCSCMGNNNELDQTVLIFTIRIRRSKAPPACIHENSQQALSVCHASTQKHATYFNKFIISLFYSVSKSRR